MEALPHATLNQTWYQSKFSCPLPPLADRSRSCASSSRSLPALADRSCASQPIDAMALSNLVNSPAAPPVATAPALLAPTVSPIGVRLEGTNFPLWRMLAFTNLSGASLHGYLDGSTKAPAETIQEGTGTAARPSICGGGPRTRRSLGCSSPPW